MEFEATPDAVGFRGRKRFMESSGSVRPAHPTTLLFYPVLLLSMLVITLVPQLSTWLPNLVFAGP